jgi:hypothetical protein
VFDSLKSLPTSPWDANPSAPSCGASPPPCNLVATDVVDTAVLRAALDHMASTLGSVLGLSLFGFDVVAVRTACDQYGAEGASTALHIIDVNYLPNFRVPGAATFVRRVIADAVNACTSSLHTSM